MPRCARRRRAVFGVAPRAASIAADALPGRAATMTFAHVGRPGLVPFALVRSQGGSEGFVRVWGACATLVHAFSLSSISTVFHLTVAMFCVFFARTGRPGTSSTTATRRGVGSSRARARAPASPRLASPRLASPRLVSLARSRARSAVDGTNPLALALATAYRSTIKQNVPQTRRARLTVSSAIHAKRKQQPACHL